VSYVDHGPALGLILGLVFGFALPVTVIVLLLAIFCVRRKRRMAEKHGRVIVRMTNRMDQVHNSHQDRAAPRATELQLLQSAPVPEQNTRYDEPEKGELLG